MNIIKSIVVAALASTALVGAAYARDASVFTVKLDAPVAERSTPPVFAPAANSCVKPAPASSPTARKAANSPLTNSHAATATLHPARNKPRINRPQPGQNGKPPVKAGGFSMN